jgi:gliding motility-associated-like protein
MKQGLLLFSFLAVIFQCDLSAQIITTVAGNGTYGYSGNGGPATAAQLAFPFDVATDNSGNIYIGDDQNMVIRKVNSAGIVSDFAGNHIDGYAGDGGPAIAANLSHPTIIGVDIAGNVYLSDQLGREIRKVDLAGNITSLTGNLPPGYSGDGGPVGLAQFRQIGGLACDVAGNLYISDIGNNVIRKVDAAGIITTIAGNGTPGFSGDGGPAISAQLGGPYSVIFDNAGNMYIPDAGNSRIRKVTPAGIISTYAGNGTFGYSGDGGLATAASFDHPWDLAIDPAGYIFVSDGGNNVVRKITPAGIISTCAGTGVSGYSGDGGAATAAEMMDICGIACDNAGNVYIVNRGSFNVVRKITNCPTAIITQQPANVALCTTGNATFSVTATNLTAYTWQVNTGAGWNNLADAGVYTGTTTNNLVTTGATTAMNNYQYRCSVTNVCGSIFSSSAKLIVITPATPSITIVSSGAAICEGSSVTFTATAVNGGAIPQYQWKKNGLPVGTNSTTYIDNTLNDGDIITCMLTSVSTCIVTTTAVSNPIPVTVTANVIPTVTITASDNNICEGVPVTFTSVIVNGGANPQYTWFKNGTNLFLNSPVYTDNTLKNGDFIICAFRSGLACFVNSAVVPSNEIEMKVNPLSVPAVSITATKAGVCKNTPVVFTAASVNEGIAPVYQWKKNGQPIGINSNNYAENNPVNGDVITCILTSNSNCLTTKQASSNTIAITVFPDPEVTLDHTTTLCTGDTRQLDAGNFSSYLWNTGSTGRTIFVNNTGTYSVTVTDSHGCTGSDVASINTLLPSPSAFLPKDTSICSYGSLELQVKAGFNNYLWSNGEISPAITITQPGQYWLQATNNSNSCIGKDTINVAPKDCLKGFYIPTAFTPNGDGRNDLFKPMLFGNVKQYNFRVYDRWGQVVFQTSDQTKGWNGVFKGQLQESHVFVWICTYQFEGEKQTVEKGTVAVIK